MVIILAQCKCPYCSHFPHELQKSNTVPCWPQKIPFSEERIIHPFSTRVFHSTLPTLELSGPTGPFLSCKNDRTLGVCCFFGFVSLVTLYHGKSPSTTFWDMFFLVFRSPSVEHANPSFIFSSNTRSWICFSKVR